MGIVFVNPEKLAEVTMRKGEQPAGFAERLLEAFKTYSGITTEDVRYKFALFADYDEIIAKMTQVYNNQAISKKKNNTLLQL